MPSLLSLKRQPSMPLRQMPRRDGRNRCSINIDRPMRSFMLGVPSDILRGGVEPAQGLLLVAVQAGWTLAMFLLLRVVWRAGVREYSAVGA